jgi:hypothetical protein
MAEFKLGRLRFVWKGTWAPSTTYVKDDIIKYGGTTYVCLAGHTANSNFNVDLLSDKWEIQSSGQEWVQTPWSTSTVYKVGDLVKYGGRVYISTANHTSSNVEQGGFYTDESANRWDLFADGSEWKGNWLNTEYYKIGDIVKYNSITYICVAPHLSASTFELGLENDYSDDSSTKWEIYNEGFKFKGEWNGSADPTLRLPTRYTKNDIVKFGASLYICVVPHTSNISAFEEANWAAFVGGNEFEDTWLVSKEYQIGDIVTYGGYSYVAKSRNTGQIPPITSGIWGRLTVGYVNRARYNPSLAYKVGELVLYGGNVFAANTEVSAGETPYSTSSKWDKVLDGFRWLSDWDPTPLEAKYKLGDIVKYAASTYICIEEHTPADQTTINITNTTTGTNLITTSDNTSTLNLGQPIIFSGSTFGGITDGVTYYVRTILNSTQFSVSSLKGGTQLVLSTASGNCTADYSNRPDTDDGDFWNSFAEGDANNVLLRRGDIVTRNAIQNIRLARGAEGEVLKVIGNDLAYGKVGDLTRIFYVSIDGEDGPTRGTTWDDPWKTIKYACQFVQASGFNTRDTPVTINVKAGLYREVFPISIPKYVSLVGDELRMSIVEPTASTSGADKFYMRDSTTIRNFTFRGATGANLPDGTTDTFTEVNQYGIRRPTGGPWCSLDPGTGPNDEEVWVGERSPYIQNVTTFGDYAVGQKIDGALHNGGNKSITSNDFTQVMSDSIGAWCTNQGRAELVSVFTYYGYIGYLSENGGVIRATNGNCSYGTFGAISEGVDPTEISRTASVDNRRLDAIVSRVQTNGDKILYIEYANAGENYTTATYNFTGAGILDTINTTSQVEDGGVCEVRILNDGESYLSVQGNAQGGTDIDIRLSASDITLTNGYNGERIVIIDGQGVGQYAYITSFDGGSKVATLGMESFDPIEITATTSTGNLVTVDDTVTLSIDMPFSITGAGLGGLIAGTQYYVKAISSSTQFTVYSNPDTKATITLATASGSSLLHKSGWDVVVRDITGSIQAATQATPVVITTTAITELDTGMKITISGVSGMTQLNGNSYFIEKTGNSTIALYEDFARLVPLNGTGFTTYVSGGSIVGEQAVFPFLNTTSRYVIEPRLVFSTGEGASATAVQTPGIDTILLSSGGSGFTAIPSVIISGDGTATGGTGATATATINGGIDTVIVQAKGTGYEVAPTLTFVGGGLPPGGQYTNFSGNLVVTINEFIRTSAGNYYRVTTAGTMALTAPSHTSGSASSGTATVLFIGTEAAGTANTTRTIKEIEVINGGNGYTSPPSVTVTGTGGSGAIISAQISQVVGSIIVGSGGGSNYTSSPDVIIAGGSPLVFAQARAVLSASVVSYTMQEGGNGYKPSTTTVLITGGGGLGATATAVIDNGLYVEGVTPGIVTSITVDTGGSDYSTPPTVSIFGEGVDASATANIRGSVATIVIDEPGRGYQTVPTVTLTGGGGAGATATAALTGSIISLTVVDGGSGWVGTPALSFAGGGGAGASANVTAMDTVLSSVTITSFGAGYTRPPAIALSGSTGSGGILRSRLNASVTGITVTDPGGSFLVSPLITFAAGGNYKSSVAGQRYYANASALVAIGTQQQIQTLAGIDQLRVVARAVITNAAPAVTYQSAISRVSAGGGFSAPTGIQSVVDFWTNSVLYTIENGENYRNAAQLLTLNREFIRRETEAFWDSNFPGTATAVWSRDVGLLVDAVISDISRRGVDFSINAAIKQVFLGTARSGTISSGNLLVARSGIDFIKDLALNIVQNVIVSSPELLTGITATTTAITTNYITLSDTSDLVEGQRILFIGTAFGGIVSNRNYFIKEVVNGTTIIISETLGGSPVLLTNGSGTLLVSTQVVNDTLTLETGSTIAVENCFDLVKSGISVVLGNSTTYLTAANLLESNKNYIRAEVIAFINTTYTDFDYDQVLCARDVGLIVDSVVYDIKNSNDVSPVVTSSTTGVVSSITVDNGGTGYSYGVDISISGGGTPTVVATAVPIIDEITGEILSFTMTNKGKGYSSTPSVTITPDSGTGAFARCLVVGSNVTEVSIINPGSGYTAGPHISLIDPNNTDDARFQVRIADGVLAQPKFTSRGTGYTTADALISGDGYADIAQVGQFVFVKNLTNVPTPGANIQFDNNDQFYKLVTVRELIGPTGIVGARNLLVENKRFIQSEIISYLNNFVYNSTKCSRDVGLIIDALADDRTYGTNHRLLSIINSYYQDTYSNFEDQRMQTAFALQHLRDELAILFNDDGESINSPADSLDFVIEWIKNGTRFDALPTIIMPDGNFDVQDDNGKDQILINEDFIVDQGINKLLNDDLLTGFDQDIVADEIRQIVRSIAYDLAYEGNEETVRLGRSYYIDDTTLSIPGVADSLAAKSEFLLLVDYLKIIIPDIVRGQTVSVETNVTEIQNVSLPAGDNNTATRVNNLFTDLDNIIDDGPTVALAVGTGSVVLVLSSTAGFTLTEANTLIANKTDLQNSVIDWIDDNFVNFTYDQAVCYRDTGLIVQAIADDIYGDVAKSVEAGQRYYAATAALVLSEQKPQTIAAINQINVIVQKVIRNETYTRTQNDELQVRFPTITDGDEASEQLENNLIIIRRILEHGSAFNQVKQILLDNKTFLQSEVVAYVNANYENLNYSQPLCFRDVGLIVDSLAYDIFGGLSRSREAGLRYYQSESAIRAITGDQAEPTRDAIEHLREIVKNVILDQEPVVRFQEAVDRTRDSTIVFDVSRLSIDDKIDTCIDEVLNIINNGPAALPLGRYTARLQISPPLTIFNAPAHDDALVVRNRYSQIRLTGHDFLNIGTGSKNDTNYPGIPLNEPNPLREVLEFGGGRVFYTSTDQDGNFRVGDLFRVEQSTGIATLNADAFNLSGLNELSLGGVSLGGSGAVINEFSTDGTFFANADNIVPTQKAIKTYIQASLGSGGGNIAVNAVTAGDTFITRNEIDTIGGLQLQLLSTLGVKVLSGEASTSTGTGALIVGGGIGIGGAANIGGNVVIDGTLTVTNTGFVKLASGTTAERPLTSTSGMIRFNTSTSQFEGYNGAQWAQVGGGNPWAARTSNYTAVNNDRLIVNTSATSITITLPASPSLGDSVRFIDGAGTFDINVLNVDRNGQLIMGEAENMTVNTKNAAFSLVYYNSTYGWRLGEA